MAQLALRLGRAHSTIRWWRDRYAAFVPERQDRAGRQLLPLERLEEIAVLASQRLTPREIEQTLEQRHGAPTGERPPPEPDRLDQLLAEVRVIREQVDYLVERERARTEE